MPINPRMPSMDAGMPYSTALRRPAVINPAPPANAWTLPVVGMGNAPGRFEAGGTPQWSAGSFGYQKPISKGGHVHQGVDIYASRGTAVIAPVAGSIMSINNSPVSGNYVKVRGDDGYTYFYAHLDSVHSGLARGQRVGQGDYLGGVGNTGNASGTSTHLHFEVRKNGKSVNPNAFFETGQRQETTPMSAIAGLNTVEEMQAYIDEQIAAAQVMAQGAEGFDPRGWGQQDAQPSEEDMINQQTAKGQNILGATLTSMATAIGGGSRSELPRNSTAMQATTSGAAQGGGQVTTPRAEDIRPEVQSEVSQ